MPTLSAQHLCLHAIGTFVLALMAFTGAAQSRTVEAVAEDIARQYNASAASMRDAVLVANAATARGKNVEFSNVLKVQRGLSKAKLGIR